MSAALRDPSAPFPNDGESRPVLEVTLSTQLQECLTALQNKTFSPEHMSVINHLRIEDHVPAHLVPIISHEYGNIQQKLFFLELLYMDKDGINEPKNQDVINIGLDSLNAAVNLFNLVEKGYEGGDVATQEELMRSFPMSEQQTAEVLFENDNGEVVFDSLEEVLGARTLLHNVYNEAKQIKDRDIYVILRQLREGSVISYELIDNISSRWGEDLKGNVDFWYAKGRQEKNGIYPSNEGGLKMVAYLAGQRGDEIAMFDDVRGNTVVGGENIDMYGKSVRVNYANPRENAKQVSERLEGEQMEQAA